uniref:Uncharacterized protein n=1 Tax=Picea glauca TaxID=3330 RepID=A0A117NGQ6_PICGL|nr:hypothetical protein ABT39_MTgene6159 [Picea glauca]QHR88784.1 hypothetical protein Q903MT_gene2799 [Picea sitchensis]
MDKEGGLHDMCLRMGMTRSYLMHRPKPKLPEGGTGMSSAMD